MVAPNRFRSDFVRMVEGPETSIELARTALIVAAESDPAVDIDHELGVLEEWGAQLEERVDPAWNNLQKLARLRSFLFEDLGFRGDRVTYFSPSNSLFHQVMKRRRGIPLTLSIVMMELGWRIGIPFEGVGFPGHFLVRLPGEPVDLLLDPYRRGMVVREEDCRAMLKETTGGKLAFEESQLVSVGKLDMIVRLLNNLKTAYLRNGDDEQALAAVDRLLVITPEDAGEWRDRGLLLYRLQRFRPALACLMRYLEAAPGASDRDTMERHVAALRQLIASLN